MRIWDNDTRKRLIIEGRVAPAHGKVVFDYLTAGSSNESGSKEHRFTQPVQEQATLRELRQNKSLLTRDVLLFALIALPGIRDLGESPADKDKAGSHLVKLHIGLTDLPIKTWHRITLTHLPCKWTREGEVALSEPLDVYLRLQNKIEIRDVDDIDKREDLRFYGQSPFRQELTTVPRLNTEASWLHLDTVNGEKSATCLNQPETSLKNTPANNTRAYRFCLKRNRDETELQAQKSQRITDKDPGATTKSNLADKAKRFTNFLTDSIKATTSEENPDITGFSTSKVPDKPTDAETAAFIEILGEIAKDPLNFLPPAESPPFNKLSPSEEEFFNLHLGPLAPRTESLEDLGKFCQKEPSQENTNGSSSESIPDKGEYPAPNSTVESLSSFDCDSAGESPSLHFSDAQSVFSTDLFYRPPRGQVDLHNSEGRSETSSGSTEITIDYC